MAKEGKARVLTENEFKRLLIIAKDSPFSTRNIAMIYCSFGLGLRVKEIAALKITDVSDSAFLVLGFPAYPAQTGNEYLFLRFKLIYK